MLLARVAAELRTDTALSESLLPVQFMEESQEIFTLADFWNRNPLPSRQGERSA